MNGRLAFILTLIFATVGLQETQGQTYRVLHNFRGDPGDGANPFARLVPGSAGNLYGTTAFGGTSNAGVVFKLDRTGNTVLYNFKGGIDGMSPYAGLVRDPAGNLYGTTDTGGAFGCGTVFKLDTSGTETVLHSFTGGADGKNPQGIMIRDAEGYLYGTTATGGLIGTAACNGNGCGVVFKLDPSGTETILHSFTGGADGGVPSTSGVIRDSAGNLYGTTGTGGIAQAPDGWGVIFKLDASGAETVLYSFSGGADGASPQANLIRDSAGSLYGTTAFGGIGSGGYGYGVVFKLDMTGTETTLYTFTGGPDGAEPRTSLVLDSAGNLYGTTGYGGIAFDRSGSGVVFKLDTKGMQTVLHTFAGGTDGASPNSLVRGPANTFYGTTYAGGRHNEGVVFSLAP